MLRVDPTLNHIPARREHVVSLYESINQPLVNIPSHGTAPTGAYLLGTRNEHGYYTVFVYLHQPETRAVIIYVSEPRNLTADQFRIEEQEAVRFVESMGFMVDSVPFRQLAAAEQDAVMGRVPIFRPPPVTVDLYEVADDGMTSYERPIPQDVDPIFGSIGASGAEVFRRAGLGNAGQPQMPGLGSPGTPVSGSMPQMGGAFANPISPGGSPNMYATPGPSYAMFAPQIPSGGTPLPNMVQGGLQPSQSTPQAAEAFQRLGRLLAAFALPAALLLGLEMTACKSGGAETPPADDAVQSQVDVGQQQLAERRFPEAISAFAEALKEQPNDRDALRGTGFAYMSLGRFEQAEPFYRKAILADPKWSMPKNELAGILLMTRRCEEAEGLFRAVTEDIFYQTPEFAEHNLALALACEGKLQNAVELLEGTVLKRPHFCLGYLTLAQLSAQAKQPERTVKACGDFETNCAKHEKIRDQVTPEMNATCYLRSGKAYVEMGDVESARAAFSRCQAANEGIGKECRELLMMLPR